MPVIARVIHSDSPDEGWKVHARAYVTGERNSKVEAIKALRSVHRMTLMDGKDTVEAYAANYAELDAEYRKAAENTIITLPNGDYFTIKKMDGGWTVDRTQYVGYADTPEELARLVAQSVATS